MIGQSLKTVKDIEYLLVKSYFEKDNEAVFTLAKTQCAGGADLELGCIEPLSLDSIGLGDSVNCIRNIDKPNNREIDFQFFSKK